MNYSDLIKKYGMDKMVIFDFPGRTFIKSVLLDSAQKYADADKELNNLGDNLGFEDLEKVRDLIITRLRFKELFFSQAILESFVTRRYDPYERLKLEIHINNQINESIKGTVDF